MPARLIQRAGSASLPSQGRGILVFGQVFARVLQIAGQVDAGRWLRRMRDDPRFMVAWLAVALLHLAVIWILAAQIAVPRGAAPLGRDLQLTMIATGAPAPPKIDPVPEPRLQPPALDEDIAAPAIDIQPATAAPGAAGYAVADILPPRPDPAFRNAGPPLPPAFAKLPAPVQLTLTVLVSADGRIADARVAHTSGDPALDRLAQAFVKTAWHLRPATRAGKPVSDWTTVLVRFAA